MRAAEKYFDKHENEWPDTGSHIVTFAFIAAAWLAGGGVVYVVARMFDAPRRTSLALLSLPLALATWTAYQCVLSHVSCCS